MPPAERNEHQTKAAAAKSARPQGPAARRKGERRERRLTSPLTAPGSGYLAVPAAATASLPSSACPGLEARREQGQLPRQSLQREAPRAPAVQRLRCCSADGNSCLHQWQPKQEHFGSSLSSLNRCQLFYLFFFLIFFFPPSR